MNYARYRGVKSTYVSNRRKLKMVSALCMVALVLHYGLRYVGLNVKAASEDWKGMQPFCHSVRRWEENAAQSCEERNARLFDVILVSTGGVGTTSTLETLQSKWRTNSIVDGDGLKHRPFHVTTAMLEAAVVGNSSLSCATPLFIYALGDITGSIFSLYRRSGFAEAQNSKTRENPIPDSCFPKDVAKYADDGVDYLNVESHFHSFIHGGICSSTVPVVFLRVEKEMAPKIVDMINSLIEKPHETLEEGILPLNVKPSHYSTDSSTSQTYEKLYSLYERLQMQIDDLGHLSVAFNGRITRMI